MPMFPDSGVPAGDAKNSVDVNTIPGCPELWYSTSRCEPRFDPAAANAMLAEDMNLIMRGEVQYDCANLNHIERAVRYITQRGIPNGVTLQGGPFDYYGYTDPSLTRYNDYLPLIIIPNVNNQGPVRVNIDGKGWVAVLRNDGLQLQSIDLRAGVPAMIVYWGGNFWYAGLVSSQVPIVVTGAVDIWVRTDGNDVTGDGSENSPSKAFRTLSGAWYRVGSRYAATPLFTMRFRLGIPGTYVGAIFGPFGGRVEIHGDPSNRSGYRLSSIDFGNNHWGNIFFQSMLVFMRGITFVRDISGPPLACTPLIVDNSSCMLQDCDFDATVGNSFGSFIWTRAASSTRTIEGDYVWNGRGLPVGSLILCTGAGMLGWQPERIGTGDTPLPQRPGADIVRR